MACESACARTLGCASIAPSRLGSCTFRRGPRPLCRFNCSLPWDRDARHDASEVPWLGTAFREEDRGNAATKPKSPGPVAVCMAGQSRTLIHPQVWTRHARSLGQYPLFMVLSTMRGGTQWSDGEDLTALSAALHAMRPRRVRFLSRPFAPLCSTNDGSVQLHYLAECHELIPIHYEAIVRTRPDHVWQSVPDLASSLVGLAHTVVSRNDWAVIASRAVFRAWAAAPLRCARVCRRPPPLWAAVMGPDNEYCAFVAHLARVRVGHMECTHPSERQLFLRRASAERCAALGAAQIVRWTAVRRAPSIAKRNRPVVCQLGSLACRAMRGGELANKSVDVSFGAPPPTLRREPHLPWGYVHDTPPRR